MQVTDCAGHNQEFSLPDTLPFLAEVDFFFQASLWRVCLFLSSRGDGEIDIVNGEDFLLFLTVIKDTFFF